MVLTDRLKEDTSGINKMIQRQFIPFQAKSADNTFCFTGYMRQFPELFPAENIGDVYFYYRTGYRSYSIADGHRGMGVAAGIEDNTINRKTYALYFINQFTFHIALKIAQFMRRIPLLQGCEIGIKVLATVDVNLTFSKKIQVGPVDDRDFHLTNVMTFKDTGCRMPDTGCRVTLLKTKSRFFGGTFIS